MNKCLVKILFICISLFAVEDLFAQKDEVSLSGFVSDSLSGEKIIGAALMLYRSDNLEELYRAAVTNQFGYYVIPKIIKGNYVLRCRSLGYHPVSQKINVTIETGTLRNDIEMQTAEIALEEIVVEESSEETYQVSEIEIAPKFLATLPSLSGESNALQVLQLLPGVTTASEISSGLYVRGGSPDQTLSLVDGVILYNPGHLGNFATTFNSDAVQKITLIKGAFPAEYGGRLSSVLDIKLRSGSKERDKAKINLGLINSGVSLEGPIGEKSTYLISARALYYDKFQEAVNQNPELPRYNFFDVNGKFTQELTQTSILSLSTFYSKDNLYSSKNLNDIEYDINWLNSAINLGWIQANKNSLFSYTNFSYIDYQYETSIVDKLFGSHDHFLSRSRLQDLMIRRTVEFTWKTNHKFKIGAELAYHNYSLIYTDIYQEEDEALSNFEKEQSGLEASLFMQNEWRISSQFNTNIGFRVYYFRDKDFIRFEPRISASFVLTEDLYLKGAYSIANQFLHLIIRNDITLPSDLWYPSGDDITPSQSTQYVLGIEYFTPGKNFSTNLEGYYKELDELYEFKEASAILPGDALEDQITKGKGEAYGIELLINKHLGRLTGWIGYTLSWTRRKFNELNLGQIFNPRYDKRHDLSIVATYNLTESISLGLTWKYSTGQAYSLPTGKFYFAPIGIPGNSEQRFDYTERNGGRLPDYHKLDLSANYNFMFFGYSATLAMTLQNVYNRSNPLAVYTKKINEDEYRVRQINLFPFIPSLSLKLDI